MDKSERVHDRFGEAADFPPERISQLEKLGAESEIPDDMLVALNIAIRRAGVTDENAVNLVRNIFKGIIVEEAQADGVSPQMIVIETNQGIRPPAQQMN